MYKNRLDEEEFRKIGLELGLDASDVRGAVYSFFDVIFRDAKSLPFNNVSKIYSKNKFTSFAKIRCIPFIGRIGPAYSRYLKWRVNESKIVEQKHRSDYKINLSQEEIEEIAAVALSGRIPVVEKKKNYDLFQRVWMVGEEGKKLARQVIPKKKNVQD